ncbi:MAG TPA: hypothetical protein VKA70_13320 [Blastocatellia bacterium]|nr:hypothetical protein [Blastocatellia bacterium]
MYLSPLSLIQLQGAGWLTWVIVAAVALAAFYLIVFLVKRIKKAEKETEDEWSLSQRSIFTDASPRAAEHTEPAPRRTAELEESMPAPSQFPGPIPGPTEGTRSLTSSKEAGETGQTELLKSVPAVDPEPREEKPAPAPEPPQTFGQRYQPPARPEQPEQPRERGTELLTSRGPQVADRPAGRPRETAPFDDEVWAGLEMDEQTAGQTAAPPEPADEARVDSRRREMFDPPVIEAVKRRESFEPPVIEPLESPNEPPAARRKAVEARPVAVEHEARQPAPPREVVAAGPPVRASEHRSGTVLNLPAEYSDAPMVYGEVSPDRGTQAIGSLTNYGKNVDDKSGRGWKWLLALVGVVVAAVLMYYFIRPINERVDRWFNEVRDRNIAATKPPPPPEFKAQVLLARPQPGNNNAAMAKARGRVISTSDEPLENLSIELEFVRKDGAPPDFRTFPIDPPTIAAKQQGNFEFDFDTRVHSGYKPSKLLSNGAEVPFAAPGLTKKPAQPTPPQ